MNISPRTQEFRNVKTSQQNNKTTLLPPIRRGNEAANFSLSPSPNIRYNQPSRNVTHNSANQRMAPLSQIYRKIDKKTGDLSKLNESLNLSKINNNFKLPNLIADKHISHETTKKREFSEVNKSNNIFLESINSNNNFKKSNNFFTSKLRESIKSKNYQPLISIQKKGYLNIGAQFFNKEPQVNKNQKKERPIAFGVDVSRDKSNDRSSSIDSNDNSNPKKVKSNSNNSRINSGSERSDSLNKNQNTANLNQKNNNQQTEIYRINNKYNGKADRVSFAKDIYQILSQDTKKEILSCIKEFVKGEHVKDESLTNFLKLFINGLYYAYNQPSYLKIRFQPTPITMPNSNSDYKKTLFIEPFYVFALLEDHMTNQSSPTQNQFGFDKLVFKIRPHTKKFLETQSEFWEIYFYSSRKKIIVNDIQRTVDPDNKLLKGILARENCVMLDDGRQIKDQSLITNRSLKDVVIMDYKIYSFAQNLSNGVPILHWTGDNNDNELQHMQKFLIDLSKVNDVRLKILKTIKYKHNYNLISENLRQ